LGENFRLFEEKNCFRQGREFVITKGKGLHCKGGCSSSIKKGVQTSPCRGEKSKMICKKDGKVMKRFSG